MTDTAHLIALEARLGHVFASRPLLERALTHASVSNKASNERLEFLGDRVLGLVIAEKLFADYPGDKEGVLALKFNALVRGETCAEVAEAAGLSPHVVMASAEATSGGRKKTAILGGVCEAVIAAIYLDGGYDSARGFILRHWADAFGRLGEDMRDPKTMLQEWAQSHARSARGTPVYRILTRDGPDHAPRFVVEVSVSGETPECGEGGSKRDAQQAAASAMLHRLMRDSQ